jgi:hypothetical protein
MCTVAVLAVGLVCSSALLLHSIGYTFLIVISGIAAVASHHSQR